MRFSIIVPVYNSAKYLQKCLDSLCNQTHTDYEIICVNDGSTDNSLSILEEYKSKYSQLRFYNQENKGVSAARNLGLKVANGDYIMFCDSDDWYETYSVLEDIDKYILQQDQLVDCVHFCGSTNFEYTSPKNDHVFESFETGKNLLLIYSTRQSRLFWGACYAFCYRTQVLKEYNICFDETLRCREDALFVFDFLYKAGFSIVYPNLCYYYNVHEGSLISSEDLYVKRAEDAIRFAEILIERGYTKDQCMTSMAIVAYSIGIKSLYAMGYTPEIKYRWMLICSAGKSVRKLIKVLMIMLCPKIYQKIFV